MPPTNCLNCEASLVPAHRFCPQCGQKTDTHRLSLHDISHDAVHYLTHADKSIFRLLKELLQKPGLVAREYIAGRRQKHFKPLNFFLIVAGIVVFMTTTFYRPNDLRSQQMEAGARRIQDPGRKQELLQMADRVRKVNRITGKYSNVINMVATPLFALIFWAFYRRRFNYTESLIANMYFIGFTMLVYALLIVPLQSLFPRWSIYWLAVFFLFEVGYRGFAYHQCAQARGPAAAMKSYGISLLITLLWVALTFTLIRTYIRSGF